MVGVTSTMDLQPGSIMLVDHNIHTVEAGKCYDTIIAAVCAKFGEFSNCRLSRCVVEL